MWLSWMEEVTLCQVQNVTALIPGTYLLGHFQFSPNYEACFKSERFQRTLV